MATQTTVNIVNHALLLCGASPITALSDDTANARSVNAVYEAARKSFLTQTQWTFNTTRSTLVTNSTTSLFPWTFDEEGYVYNRPGTTASGNCLRIWEMSTRGAVWREEGDYIIADTSGLGARWAWDNDQLGTWRSSAVIAFMDKLCADISFMILNSVEKSKMFLEKYEKISLPTAMAENGQTGEQQWVQDDYWTNSRLGMGGNPGRSYS